jgi:hypothetical protein
MSKRGKEYTKHHILPTSQWGANISKNIEVIPDVQHRAIHTLFANQLIARQLITTIDISSKALLPEVKEWLIEVLNSKDINNPSERYKEDCIR